MNWFHYHGKKLNKTDAQGLISQITDAAVQKPVKDRILIAYQREYYEDRIRTTYDVLLSQAQDEWKTAVASGDTTEHKEPTPVAIRTKAAKTVWEQETQEFRDEFQARVDAEYKQAMESFLNRHQTPSTAEEYHRYVCIFLS